MATSAAVGDAKGAEAGARVVSIDVLKGILAVGMIYGHVACLLGEKELSPARALMGVLSVFTFPGFLSCFGYAAQIAYFSKGLDRSWRRLLANGLRILLAFYISAVGFRLLVSETDVSAGALLRIVTLFDVAPYSEFIIAFALYMLLSVALFSPIKRLLDRPAVFWPVIVALLLTTFVPYDRVSSVRLGLLIGTAQTPTYPVLQFAPYFLIGAFFRRHDLRLGLTTVLISAGCTAVFAVCYAISRDVPAYPPTLAWVLGAPLPLCLVYAASSALAARGGAVTAVLQRFGENVLFCLLASNLMLFALYRVWPGHVLPPAQYLPLSVALIAIIYYLITTVYRPRRP